MRMSPVFLASIAVALFLSGCIGYQSPGYPRSGYHHDRGIKPWEWIGGSRERSHNPERRYESETDIRGDNMPPPTDAY